MKRRIYSLTAIIAALATLYFVSPSYEQFSEFTARQRNIILQMISSWIANGNSFGVGGGSGCSVVETVLVVYVPTCHGVVGDGITDDSTAWATFLSSVPDGSTIWMPNSLITALGSTLDISGTKGLNFEGTVAGTGTATTTGQPTFKWIGANGGVMMLCSWCQNAHFKGIFFDLNDKADVGFRALYNGAPTYGVEFDSVTFHRGATGARTGAILLDWCGTGATSNCEQLTVRKSYFVGAGMGSTSVCIYIGHSNARENVITQPNIGYCHQGIYDAGGATIIDPLFDHNDVDIQAATTQPLTVIGGTTENGKGFINGFAFPISIGSFRFGTPDAGITAWITITDGHGESTVHLFDSAFTAADTTTPFAGGAARISSENNWYSTSAISSNHVTSMSTFTGGWCTKFDQYFGGAVYRECSMSGSYTDTIVGITGTGDNKTAIMDYSAITNGQSRTFKWADSNIDFSAALSATISVRKGDDSGACNIVVANGIITSTTC